MEVFFIVTSIIIALVLSAFNKKDKDRLIKALPQLKEDFKLEAIESKDPEILGKKLQGSYNGFDLQIRFQKEASGNSNSEIKSIIKIDLNLLSPYTYHLSPFHSPAVETFYDYFDIQSTDPKFKRKEVFQKSQTILMENHPLIRGSNWNIERAVLTYEGVNFLEDEDDLQKFKQVLKVITVVAKDIQNYLQQSAKDRSPFFNQLGKALKYEAVLKKNHLIFSTFQATELNMPYLLYYHQLNQGELLFLSLQLKASKQLAKFEIRLKKDPKFQLSIFPDHSNMISSWFKGQDIEIRDEEFDKTFVIQSDDQLKAKQLLVNQDFRTDLLELSSHELKWSLTRDQIHFQLDWEDADKELANKLKKLIESSLKVYENL